MLASGLALLEGKQMWPPYGVEARPSSVAQGHTLPSVHTSAYAAPSSWPLSCPSLPSETLSDHPRLLNVFSLRPLLPPPRPSGNQGLFLDCVASAMGPVRSPCHTVLVAVFSPIVCAVCRAVTALRRLEEHFQVGMGFKDHLPHPAFFVDEAVEPQRSSWIPVEVPRDAGCRNKVRVQFSDYQPSGFRVTPGHVHNQSVCASGSSMLCSV